MAKLLTIPRASPMNNRSLPILNSSNEAPFINSRMAISQTFRMKKKILAEMRYSTEYNDDCPPQSCNIVHLNIQNCTQI